MSTQILTAPESLGTTTTAYQGVCSRTGDITPKLCMRYNSACTLARSGSGILCGVLRVNGQLFGFNLIVYSWENVPSPENKAGYCEIIFFSFEHTVTTSLVS